MAVKLASIMDNLFHRMRPWGLEPAPSAADFDIHPARRSTTTGYYSQQDLPTSASQPESNIPSITELYMYFFFFTLLAIIALTVGFYNLLFFMVF